VRRLVVGFGECIICYSKGRYRSRGRRGRQAEQLSSEFREFVEVGVYGQAAVVGSRMTNRSDKDNAYCSSAWPEIQVLIGDGQSVSTDHTFATDAFSLALLCMTFRIVLNRVRSAFEESLNGATNSSDPDIDIVMKSIALRGSFRLTREGIKGYTEGGPVL
jgi:hypothetical protein